MSRRPTTFSRHPVSGDTGSKSNSELSDSLKRVERGMNRKAKGLQTDFLRSTRATKLQQGSRGGVRGRRTRYHHDPAQRLEAAQAVLDRPELAQGCVLVLDWARRVVERHESQREPQAGQLTLELEVAR